MSGWVLREERRKDEEENGKFWVELACDGWFQLEKRVAMVSWSPSGEDTATCFRITCAFNPNDSHKGKDLVQNPKKDESPLRNTNTNSKKKKGSKIRSKFELIGKFSSQLFQSVDQIRETRFEVIPSARRRRKLSLPMSFPHTLDSHQSLPAMSDLQSPGTDPLHHKQQHHHQGQQRSISETAPSTVSPKSSSSSSPPISLSPEPTPLPSPSQQQQQQQRYPTVQIRFCWSPSVKNEIFVVYCCQNLEQILPIWMALISLRRDGVVGLSALEIVFKIASQETCVKKKGKEVSLTLDHHIHNPLKEFGDCFDLLNGYLKGGAKTIHQRSKEEICTASNAKILRHSDGSLFSGILLISSIRLSLLAKEKREKKLSFSRMRDEVVSIPVVSEEDRMRTLEKELNNLFQNQEEEECEEVSIPFLSILGIWEGGCGLGDSCKSVPNSSCIDCCYCDGSWLQIRTATDQYSIKLSRKTAPSPRKAIVSLIDQLWRWVILLTTQRARDLNTKPRRDEEQQNFSSPIQNHAEEEKSLFFPFYSIPIEAACVSTPSTLWIKYSHISGQLFANQDLILFRSHPPTPPTQLTKIEETSRDELTISPNESNETPTVFSIHFPTITKITLPNSVPKLSSSFNLIEISTTQQNFLFQVEQEDSILLLFQLWAISIRSPFVKDEIATTTNGEVSPSFSLSSFLSNLEKKFPPKPSSSFFGTEKEKDSLKKWSQHFTVSEESESPMRKGEGKGKGKRDYGTKKEEKGQISGGKVKKKGILFEMERNKENKEKNKERSRERMRERRRERNCVHLDMLRDNIFLDLLCEGIPNLQRPLVWQITSGSLYKYVASISNSKRKKVIQQIPEIFCCESITKESQMELFTYEDYLSYIRKNLKKPLFMFDIEKDLERSFPDHPLFQTQWGIGSLRRVLVAFGIRNPEIGYCQSMNIICSFFLCWMDEEMAFWLLCTIVEDLLVDYYSSSMAGVCLDQKVLQVLVSEYLPSLSHHLNSLDIALPMITMKWFMCLFIQCISPSPSSSISSPSSSCCPPLSLSSWGTTLRILDNFFATGVLFLFQASLGILDYYENQILEMDESFDVLYLLRRCDGLEMDQLFERIEKFRGLVSLEMADNLRESYWPEFLVALGEKEKEKARKEDKSTSSQPVELTEEEENQLQIGWEEEREREKESLEEERGEERGEKENGEVPLATTTTPPFSGKKKHKSPLSSSSSDSLYALSKFHSKIRKQPHSFSSLRKSHELASSEPTLIFGSDPTRKEISKETLQLLAIAGSYREGKDLGSFSRSVPCLVRSGESQQLRAIQQPFLLKKDFDQQQQQQSPLLSSQQPPQPLLQSQCQSQCRPPCQSQCQSRLQSRFQSLLNKSDSPLKFE